MPNYAIIEGDRIANVILAESAEIAATVTGCEVIETEGQPWTDWVLVDGEWVEPTPEPEPEPVTE